MADYIDREAFKKSVEERYCKPCKAEGKDHNGCWCRACWVDDMLDEVDCFSPSDVAPVVHGRWVSPHWNNSNYCCNCSECGGEAMHKEYRWNSKGIYPTCPWCGARMDGDAE